MSSAADGVDIVGPVLRDGAIVFLRDWPLGGSEGGGTCWRFWVAGAYGDGASVELQCAMPCGRKFLVEGEAIPADSAAGDSGGFVADGCFGWVSGFYARH